MTIKQKIKDWFDIRKNLETVGKNFYKLRKRIVELERELYNYKLYCAKEYCSNDRLDDEIKKLKQQLIALQNKNK